MLGIIAILALALAFRLVPLSRRKWFGNDAYYHMLVSRWWRRYHKYPKTNPDLLPTNANTYPPLLQVLIYPFASIDEKVAFRILSPLLDVLTIILLYLTSEWMMIELPLLPPLIYALSAANLLDASTLNPRPLGNLLLAATVMVMLRYAETGDLFLYLILILAEAFVLLSHKLSTQVLLAFVIVFSIVMMSDPKHPERAWPMLGTIPFSILLAAVLTGGAYIRKILPDHILYIGVHLKQGEYKTRRRAIPSPIALFKSNPVAYASPFLGLYLYFQNAAIPAYGIWLPWAGTVLVLAQFWVWGDSWRYLQLGTFPSSMILVHFVTTRVLSEDEIALIFTLIIVGLAAIAYIQVRNALRRDVALRIATWLRILSTEWRSKLRGARIYSNVQHYIVPYITGAATLLGGPSSEGNKHSFRITQLSKASLNDIAEYASKELGEPIDYFLIFKGFPSPSTKGFALVHDSRDVEIYRASNS